MRRLPPGTAATVRAAARYPIWASVVYAFLRAALRADATRIDLVLDAEAWRLVCRSNAPGAALLALLDPDLAHLGLLHVEAIVDGTPYTRLVRGAHVLYAGPSPQRSRGHTTCVTLRDAFARLPVRRRVLRGAHHAELRRVRACVEAWALAAPHTHLTLRTPRTRLVTAPCAPSLAARAHCVCGSAAFPHTNTPHTVRVQRVLGAWRATLYGVVGATTCATPGHQHLVVNHVPLPRTSGRAAAYMMHEMRLLDGFPWQDSAAYDRIGAGDGSLHTHVARLLSGPPHLPHTHAAFVVHLALERVPLSDACGAPPRSWYALCAALLAPAPRPAPLRRGPCTTSRYFAAQRREWARSDAGCTPPSLWLEDAAVHRVAPPAPDALHTARVVAQVDRKYIVCVCAPATLLILDQHAADERVHLESLVASYVLRCLEASTAQTPMHQHACPPVTVPADALLLTHAHCEMLHFWGFQLRRTPTSWVVDAVPYVLPRLARDTPLLTQVLAAFGAQQAQTAQHWLKALDPHARSAHMAAWRHLPALMTHLVATHVCHRAIRTSVAPHTGFNQALSHEQCQRLVSQLAETAFPFQCAHGRPSAVCVQAAMPDAHPPVHWAWFATR